jgi:hypothetical protein
MFPYAPALLLALSLVLASGCKSDAERARLAQTARLAEQVDRLRRADNPDKRALLGALQQAECHEPEACAFKDLCVRAYELHQRALDSIARLRQLAEQGTGTLPQGSAAELGQVQEELDRAKVLTEQCAEEQVRVVRKSLL